VHKAIAFKEHDVIGDTVTGGLRVFILIWVGQLVSLIGSGLTSFALGVWTYERTGSVTKFALISLFMVLPGVVISPLAGALVDRWDRRWAMIFSDSGAGLCTLIIALLLLGDRLETWHIYLAVGCISIFNAFQWPAYIAATALLVPKRHFGRVGGMIETGRAAAQIVAPALAGVLVLTIHVQGVVLLDFATFLLALIMLLLVRFPRPEPLGAEEEGIRGSLMREAGYGWSYIRARAGLMGLLLFFATSNFLLGIVGVLVTPLVLAFASAAALGTVLTVSGSGMLLGSFLMSIWGGPRRRIKGVLGFMFASGVCVMLAGLRPSVSLLALAGFCYFFSFPILNGCSQAIWQSKVAPGVQGRVFAIRRMIAWSTLPLAYLLAGPLADHIFEPLLAADDGRLAASAGRVIGVGPGRGIGLMFILMGFMTMLVAVCGYLYPRVRLVENELPDAIEGDAQTKEEQSRQADPALTEEVSQR
jgi:hypothetical protein